MTIEPRDLMRYIDGKHQVLIIDYRNDQAEVIRCSSTGRLLVAQVPADAVVPGLALLSSSCNLIYQFSTLIRFLLCSLVRLSVLPTAGRSNLFWLIPKTQNFPV